MRDQIPHGLLFGKQLVRRHTDQVALRFAVMDAFDDTVAKLVRLDGVNTMPFYLS